MTANRSPSSLLLLRGLVAGLGLVLALVLISRGNVVIGALVGAIALTRVAVLVVWARRRKDLQGRVGRRFPR